MTYVTFALFRQAVDEPRLMKVQVSTTAGCRLQGITELSGGWAEPVKRIVENLKGGDENGGSTTITEGEQLIFNSKVDVDLLSSGEAWCSKQTGINEANSTTNTMFRNRHLYVPDAIQVNVKANRGTNFQDSKLTTAESHLAVRLHLPASG